MDDAGYARSERQTAAKTWFYALRDRIHAALEELERDGTARDSGHPPAKFVRRDWQRAEGGGGTIGLLSEGRVFEKAGVNVSEVFGEFSEAFRKEMPGADQDPRFWACGISLVIHPRSPHVPPVHMNTRHIVTSKAWFGGGADLNPIREEAQDTADFHAAMRAACDRFDPAFYPRFKTWADEYFFNKHRNEPRGVGGIFYDYLDQDWSRDFAFTQAVGEAYLTIYPQLVRRHFARPWGEEERQHQLFRRGRYAEFNLVYDRGTRFGLMTGGNPEAILMSLPPLAAWP